MKPSFVAIFFGFIFSLSSAFANGKTNLIAPQLLCSETCQHWDKFNDVCLYKTTCTIDSTLVTAKQCSRWDNFDNVCQSESVSRRFVRFDTSVGSPECIETCQHENNFGDCLYSTKCEVTPACAFETKCQYWDRFNEVCFSESTDRVCNIRQ